MSSRPLNGDGFIYIMNWSNVGEIMNWSDVGGWIKEHAGTGVSLIGSLLTGNVPGAVAAGVSLVSGATGTDDPAQALQALQADPKTMVKLKELYYQNEASVRQHIETMERLKLEDAQHEQHETQETIRTGDIAVDEYVRRTRPTMAKQSWVATITYCIGCFGVHALTGDDLFELALAGVLSAPAWAYLGLRTGDKFASAWQQRGAKK